MKFVHRRPEFSAACLVTTLAFLSSSTLGHAQCPANAIATKGATDPRLSDLAGMSLTINAAGDRVAFGSGGHSHVGSGRGAAWIVSNPGSSTSKTVELMPAVGLDNTGFGARLAMNAVGDVLLAGAPTGSGSQFKPRAYVFRFNGTSWVEEWSTVSAQWDSLSISVAMDASGDLIALGAPGRTFAPNWDPNTGGVDIYRRENGGWSLEKSLTLSPNGYVFGARLGMSADGNLLAVSSLSGAVNGSVYLFQRNGGAWNQVGVLNEAVSHSGNGGFGSGIAVDARGETVVIGNPSDWRMGSSSGAVFMFRKIPTGWVMEGEMLLPSVGVGYTLGTSVAINAAGDSVFAGASGHSQSNLYAGAVLEYERVNGAWQQVGLHFSPTSEKWGHFGKMVASSASGRRWAASEWAADFVDFDTGLVHVFESPCVAPTIYCTAQTNSLGCVPQIGFQGAPSVSASSGFSITASNTRNQRSGLLFYGTNGAQAFPWKGGTLCVKPPLVRTPLQLSGGNPAPANDCSGSFSFDFNTWRASSSAPSLFAGQHVLAQYYSRDPSALAQINLTDALDFYLEP